MMRLSTKLYLLTVILHSLLLVAAYWFVDKPGIEFIAVEVFIVVSLGLFVLLIRKAMSPMQFLDLFKDVLQEQEYNARFSKTHSLELDKLMALFNQMLQQLYNERLKLGDRKGMLHQLMNAIPSGIIVFDYNDKITQLNPAAEKLLGIASATVESKPLKAIEHAITEKLEALTTGESQLISDRTGKRYRCHRSNFRDRGFDRQFIVIVEITDDLQSSEKNTYEKLIRLMSHEVNNTMAATSSLLKSCLYYADQIDPEEREDYENAMHLVIERTDNLNHFMQDFANMVRLPKPSLELCNLQHLLLSTARLFEVQLKEVGIKLTLPVLAVEQAQVMADRNQLEQVLINIVKNAKEAIGKEGQIDIELAIDGKHLCLKVNDTGSGLTEASAQDIFTPFFTTKAEGQGLGLMLVREILDAHGLDFALYNRQVPSQVQRAEEQNGACFEIRFEWVGEGLSL
ncbi:MAG: PAS domain-containing protein [Algicola sp.]|nr:PAS domain-containing protein [Algicola sp.]